MRFTAHSRRDPRDGRELHTVTTPRSGPGREKARGALLEILERSAGHDGHRVAFRVFIDPDAPPVTVGGKGGYDPARALAACRAELGDPFAWLVSQLAGRLDPVPAAGAITRVDVLSIPSGAARRHDRRPGHQEGES